MPIFFQQQINDTTRLGIWKIEETEEYFKSSVPQHRAVTHPHKRLQHLAGRFLLRYLYPDFPFELIQIADTRKPYLPDARYHFSISHCGDYAAAIVSSHNRVGVDIEIPVVKILRIQEKFLTDSEKEIFNVQYPMLNIQQSSGNTELITHNPQLITLLWSAKEAIFKWYGEGGVDFREHIQLQKQHAGENVIDCLFSKNSTQLQIHYHAFDHLVLAWVVS